MGKDNTLLYKVLNRLLKFAAQLGVPQDDIRVGGRLLVELPHRSCIPPHALRGVVEGPTYGLYGEVRVKSYSQYPFKH